MKNHKFQQIRVLVNLPGDSLRISAQTDKQYSRIRGIFVSIPEDRFVPGALLGLKVNNQEIFEDAHEVRMLTTGNQVAPNKKFFLFEEQLEAGGSAIEGKFSDGQIPIQNQDPNNPPFGYPYEVKIYLWLINETTSN